MANLHFWVVLAQYLAERRKQYRSNAAFGQWVKNDPEVLRVNRGPLTHQDRAALIKIAQLDLEQASAAIRRSRYSTPEHLWRNDLKYLAVHKTPPAAPVRKTAEAVRKTHPEPVRKTEPEDEDDDLGVIFDWRERRRERLSPDHKATIAVGVIREKLLPLVNDLVAEGRKTIATKSPPTVLHRASLLRRQIDEWGQPDPHDLSGQPDPVRKTERGAVVSVRELRQKLLPHVRALQAEGRKNDVTMSLDTVARHAELLQQQLDEWGNLTPNA